MRERERLRLGRPQRGRTLAAPAVASRSRRCPTARRRCTSASRHSPPAALVSLLMHVIEPSAGGRPAAVRLGLLGRARLDRAVGARHHGGPAPTRADAVRRRARRAAARGPGRRALSHPRAAEVRPDESAAGVRCGGVWLNAVWASHGRSAAREPLGTSDGNPDQTLRAAARARSVPRLSCADPAAAPDERLRARARPAAGRRAGAARRSARGARVDAAAATTGAPRSPTSPRKTCASRSTRRSDGDDRGVGALAGRSRTSTARRPATAITSSSARPASSAFPARTASSRRRDARSSSATSPAAGSKATCPPARSASCAAASASSSRSPTRSRPAGGAAAELLRGDATACAPVAPPSRSRGHASTITPGSPAPLRPRSRVRDALPLEGPDGRGSRGWVGVVLVPHSQRAMPGALRRSSAIPCCAT